MLNFGTATIRLPIERYHLRGGVAEWTNAVVLKTAEVQAFVGSNPTPSAT
jgi:hypothetical protein